LNVGWVHLYGKVLVRGGKVAPFCPVLWSHCETTILVVIILPTSRTREKRRGKREEEGVSARG
jgi:hypothetical protein